MTCSQCGTTGWKGSNCPFCGHHEHGQRGKICSCGQYIATRAEERRLEKYQQDAELDLYDLYRGDQ